MPGLFLAVIAVPAFAAQPTALFLLDAQPNIRQYSMGGVFSAVNSGDAVSNPWELGYAVNPSAYFAHWLGAVAESQYNFISAVAPYKKIGGFSLSYLNYGTGSETFEELDGTKKSIKLEDDKVIAFGYGRNIGERLFVGGSLKYLSSTLAGQYKANAMLKDFGAVYRTLDDKHTFGAAVLNSGNGLNYYQTKEQVPTELRMGYSIKFKPYAGQKLVCGIGYGSSAITKNYSTGVEYFPAIPFISIQAGASRRKDETKFTAGMGFNYRSFEIAAGYDLSTAKTNDGQSPMRFALSWEFGAKGDYSAAEKYIARGMKNKAVALWENIKPGEPKYSEARKIAAQYANPPEISAEAVLEDKNKDGFLSPDEAGNIKVTLSNIGKGKALELKSHVESADKALALRNMDIGFYDGAVEALEPGQSASFKIPVKALSESEAGNMAFRITVKESRGFNPNPLLFTVKLKGFSPPQLALARYTFREDNSGNSSGNGNGIIEKSEQIEVTGYVINGGITNAMNVSVEVVSGSDKVELAGQALKQNLGTLKPGEYRKIVFTAKIDGDYSGPPQLPITLNIIEERKRFSKRQLLKLALGSFYKDPIAPVFQDFDSSGVIAALPALSGPISDSRAQEVLKFISNAPPSLEFEKQVIQDGDINGNGVYEPGETYKIKVGVRNTGGQTAKNVQIVVDGDEVIKTLLGTQEAGDIPAGSYKQFTLEAGIPDNIPRKEASFSLHVTEAQGFNANKVEELRIAFQSKKVEIIKQLASLQPVPDTAGKNEKAAAVVVGISKYKKVSSLNYPSTDADITAAYLSGVMGIPQKNIKVVKDDAATGSTIKALVNNWLVKKDFETIVFYFAGHGMPDPDNPKRGAPYLVPNDGDLDPSLGNGTLINLNDLIADMEGSKAKEVIVLLDSCFSGQEGRTPEQYAMAHRGIAAGPKFNQQRAFVFSGSKENQASFEFEKAGHGYFTYYLLLGLKGEADKDKDGIVTDTELCNYTQQRMNEALEGRQTPICSNEGKIQLGRYR